MKNILLRKSWFIIVMKNKAPVCFLCLFGFGVFVLVWFLIGVPFFECLLFIYAFNIRQALIDVGREMEMDQDLKLRAASVH